MNKPDASWKHYLAAAASTLALNGCAEDKPKHVTWPDNNPPVVDNFEKQQPAPKVEHVQPKEDPKITAISEDTQERKRGMDMAQRIIDRRPKSPADFSSEPTQPEKLTFPSEMEDLTGDLKIKVKEDEVQENEAKGIDVSTAEDGSHFRYERTPENKRVNDLFREVQALVQKSTDTKTMEGIITAPGKKRLRIEHCSGECSSDIKIRYGDEQISADQYLDQGAEKYNVWFDRNEETEDPAQKKKIYARMTAMLQEVKWILQHPVKVTPSYMVVKAVPDTIKNLGANMRSHESADRISVLPPNTLIKVVSIDPGSGYAYTPEGGRVHTKFLAAYDAKNFHPENFGVKKVRVRKNEETVVNGLNFRNENNQVIGAIPHGTVLDLLALENTGSELRALVQYRDADGKLKTGFLTATEFQRGRIYLDGIK